jgi:hypothetical protein
MATETPLKPVGERYAWSCYYAMCDTNLALRKANGDFLYTLFESHDVMKQNKLGRQITETMIWEYIKNHKVVRSDLPILDYITVVSFDDSDPAKKPWVHTNPITGEEMYRTKRKGPGHVFIKSIRVNPDDFEIEDLNDGVRTSYHLDKDGVYMGHFKLKSKWKYVLTGKTNKDGTANGYWVC